jgi:hypothetical protein
MKQRRRSLTLIVIGAVLAMALFIYTNTPKTVTVSELLANPTHYAGHEIRVTGYLMQGLELSALFNNADSAVKATNRLNAIWIDVPIDSRWEGTVQVVGIFMHDPRFGAGHLNLYPSSITDVKEFLRTREVTKN